jgi:hypothetical protein
MASEALFNTFFPGIFCMGYRVKTVRAISTFDFSLNKKKQTNKTKKNQRFWSFLALFYYFITFYFICVFFCQL